MRGAHLPCLTGAVVWRHEFSVRILQSCIPQRVLKSALPKQACGDARSASSVLDGSGRLETRVLGSDSTILHTTTRSKFGFAGASVWRCAGRIFRAWREITRDSQCMPFRAQNRPRGSQCGRTLHLTRNNPRFSMRALWRRTAHAVLWTHAPSNGK